MTKKRAPRAGLKQSHRRIDPSVRGSASFSSLVAASVGAGSTKTYRSAINTIRKFLGSLRNMGGHGPEVSSITPDEFTQFLSSCAVQKSASAKLYRSALLFEQHRCGVVPFCQERRFILAAKGACRGHVKSKKGIISPDQLEELCGLVRGAHGSFTDNCKKCNFLAAASFNLLLSQAIYFQFWGQLRPGELESVHVNDLIFTTERQRSRPSSERSRPAVLPASFTVSSLFFVHRKNEEDTGFYRIPDAAVGAFQALAAGKSPDSFIVPKCMDTHIGVALRKAAIELQWNPNVVWVAHALRHSAFSDLEAGVLGAVDGFVAQVCTSTLRGTYTKGVGARRATGS